MQFFQPKTLSMGEKIDRLLSKPVYPFAYGCVFFVFKSSAYFGSFRILPSLCSLLIFFFVTRFLSRLLQKLTGAPIASLVTTLIWASLFHVVGVAQLFHYPYAYIPFKFYVAFYASVVLLCFIICMFSKGLSSLLQPSVYRICNVFLLMCCAVFLITGLKRSFQTKLENRVHDHMSPAYPDLVHHTDIVWILMDEYGASASLKEQFDFSNPLDSFLEKKHYCILQTMHSRENSTLFSVNSIFNLDDSIRPSSFYEGIELLRHGALIPLLESRGYTFVNLGFFDMAEHPMLADRSGYPYSYQQQLFSGTLFNMIYMHWKNLISRSDQYNSRILQNLSDQLSKSAPQPRFIWAHMTIPHEPFSRNRFGAIQKDTAVGEMDSLFIKRKYIDYLSYGNSILMSLIKQHPDLSDKIVIISGDHGPRFPYLNKKEYQKWPFAAIHFPDEYDTAGLNKLEYISQIPGFLLKHLSGK